MKCTIETLENPNFFHLRLSCSSSLPLEKGLIEEICEIIIVQDKPLVLIDVSNLSADTTIADDFYDASKLARKLRGRVHRLAILETKRRKKFVDFFETVAKNRGLNISAFFDEAKAVAWLKEN